MIVNNVYPCEFKQAFNSIRPNNFSYEALEAMYGYFDDLSEDIGQPFELDVIAICCEFTEYENLEEVQGNYWDIKSLDDLQNHTSVIELSNGGLVIQDF